MKKNYNGKKKENTLFSYFSKVKDPAEKESLSSIIAKTTAQSVNAATTRPNGSVTTIHSTSFTNTSSNSRQLSRSVSSTIDLTTDDDDDLVILPPQSSQGLSTSSQTSSIFSNVSSQGSETLKNVSKFNNRGWSVKAAERGPERSSQEYSASQESKPKERFDKIRLQKPRITPKPSYDWLGPDDVKPFSSRMPANASNVNTSRPRLVDEPGRAYTTEMRMKRNWESSAAYSSISSSSNSYDMERAFKWPSSQKEKKAKIKQTIENKFWSKSRSSGGKIDKLEALKMATLTSQTQNNLSSIPEYTPELSEEQQRVLSMVVTEKQSLFFTGSAGTGKSVLLRALISKLKGMYGSQVAVTASTGIAACNIGGCTLHSFAGIGIAKESAQDLVYKVNTNSRARERWNETLILIIDEISMVDGELFDKLDYIARKIRQVEAPFGGIQVVATGDFFQLPPVKPNGQSKFAFEADSWKSVVTKTVMLTKVFRQKDETFVRILNEMRLGVLSPEAISIFNSLSRVPEGDSSIQPTELYPLRNEVDNSNRRKLGELKGQLFEFTAQDKGDPRKLEQCIAPTVIHLKLHAQVMLLKNIDTDLVNGSIGVVVGFAGHGDYRTTKSCEALRTPQHQRESAMREMMRDVMLLDKEKFTTKIPWPIVRFSNGREMLFEHESWSFELPGGRDASVRSQIPLMLAWAISIHKSQGQTLERVKVDLGKVFEKGQAYVALSRATSLEKLQILNFNPSKVMAHPTVTRFYKTLQIV